MWRRTICATAENGRLEHILVRQRRGDRLSNLEVIKRRHRGVERDQRERVELWGRYDLELALLESTTSLALRSIETSASPRSMRLARVAGSGTDCAMMRLKKAACRRAALPFLVAAQDCLLARLPAFDGVGAAAGGIFLQPRLCPGIVRRRVFLCHLAVDDDRIDGCEIGERETVRLVECHSERIIVDDGELFCLGERARLQLRRRQRFRRDVPVERPFDVFCRHRRAVVEFRVFAQLERDLQSVIADVKLSASSPAILSGTNTSRCPAACGQTRRAGRTCSSTAQRPHGSNREVRIKRVDGCPGDITQRLRPGLRLRRRLRDKRSATVART